MHRSTYWILYLTRSNKLENVHVEDFQSYVPTMMGRSAEHLLNLHKVLTKFCMPRLILTLFSKFGFLRVIFSHLKKVLRWFLTSSPNFCVFLCFHYLVFGWVTMVVELRICLIYTGLIFRRRIYQRKVGLHFWKILRPHKMA